MLVKGELITNLTDFRYLIIHISFKYPSWLPNVEMADYNKLLKRAKKLLPDSSKETSRFEIPLVKGHIQGNRTIISNFSQIATVLGRTQEHLLKYILKELATPGEIKKKAVIIGRKVSASMINQKIGQYAKEFVICKECNKPDTKLIKEDRVMFIRCLACGARHPVKTKL